MIGAVILGMRRAESPEAEPSGPPWLQREDWRRGWISASAGRNAAVAAVFAVVWNAISAPLMWVLPEEVQKNGNYAALFGLVFPVVGIGLVVWAVRELIRWRKFGRSTLELKTRPGVIGGRFEAIVHTRIALGGAEAFAVKLVCVNRVTTRSGKDRHTSERVRWEEHSAIGRDSIGRGMHGVSIPVRFAIPYDCEPTRDLDPENAIIWRLEVGAAVAGVDYAARFEVPVFRTPESSAEVTGDEQQVAELISDLDSSGAWPFPDSKIRVRPFGAGGREFVFGALRNPGAAATTTAFTLLWLGSIAGQIHLGAPALFPIVTGMLGVLLVWASLSLWFRVTRVRVEPGRIAVRAGLFGLGREKRYASSEIAAISLKIGMQWGQKPYYDIRLVLSRVRKKAGGRGSMPPSQRPAGGALPDKREAEALAAAMTRTLRSGA